MNRLKDILLVVSLIIMLLMVGTIVRAHGGDTTLIHSCVTTKDGSLRVVDANGSCGKGETPLDWNIQGLQGQQGPQGPAGTSGPVQTSRFSVGPGEEYFVRFPKGIGPIVFAISTDSLMLASGTVIPDPVTGKGGHRCCYEVTDLDTYPDSYVNETAEPGAYFVIRNLTSDKTISYWIKIWY